MPLNGVEPTYDNIADGKYPGSRPLFLYVKKAHVTAIPGIKEYLAEFANAWGPDGYLIKRGLIAAPDAVRAENAEKVKNLTTLRSEEHTSELQSLMRISYAVFSLKKKKNHK